MSTSNRRGRRPSDSSNASEPPAEQIQEKRGPGTAHNLAKAQNAPRCTATRRNGEPCKAAALVGVGVCRVHGGGLPSVKAASLRAKEQARAERRPLQPIEADDAEGRGDVALAMQIRRAVAWVRYCEDRIAALGGSVSVSPAIERPGDASNADDALADVLGGLQIVSSESTEGHERGEPTSLLTEKRAVGVNTWEERLRWWSTHLAGLNKQWIAAGFEAKRIEIAAHTLDRLERAIEGICRDLGANPRDAEVRAIVQRRLTEASRTRSADSS